MFIVDAEIIITFLTKKTITTENFASTMKGNAPTGASTNHKNFDLNKNLYMNLI